MSSEKITRLERFLQWYRDLYGREWYINELPAAFSRQSEKNPLSAGTNPDSPLQKFREQIKDCMNCSLGKTRTHFVFGVGNENADLMFVGEAPGRDEDLQGIPFVGRAGQLLTKLLANINLKRSDVYIANILKCRPPNNRDPLPEEVEKCLPYLHRQIELIRPRLLVALGRVAAQNLLKTETSLSNLRKRLWQYQNIPLIVTYHPAYILRYPNMLNAAIEDMKFIMQHFRQL